jgi:hypothetical protein
MAMQWLPLSFSVVGIMFFFVGRRLAVDYSTSGSEVRIPQAFKVLLVVSVYKFVESVCIILGVG